MNNKKTLLLGASGLVGSALLNLLLRNEEVQEVKVLVRKSLKIKHPKLTQVVTNFEDLAAVEDQFERDQFIYCCIGTTMKKVSGNKNAYRKVDFNIPVGAARMAKRKGCAHFSLISAIGANPQSTNFYLNLKGQVEQEIEEMHLPSVGFYRPSFLIGDRPEFRLGEKIFGGVSRALSFLIPSKYKPITASELAAGMIRLSFQKTAGTSVYFFADIVGK